MPTEPATTALISNDIVGLGLIAATLALIFWAASGPTPLLKKIFAWVPALLLCYFIPAIYNTAGVIDGHNTSLYNPVARDVLLPAALVLLTLRHQAGPETADRVLCRYRRHHARRHRLVPADEADPSGNRGR